LAGTHTCPPDAALAPPIIGDFSSTTVVAPRERAASAATSPEKPEPTTTMSNENARMLFSF
jgi:hypothetical protein